MSAKNNIQDYILNTARKEKIELTIYLLNGVPLKGKVTSFDNFTIIIENESKQRESRILETQCQHGIRTATITH